VSHKYRSLPEIPTEARPEIYRSLLHIFAVPVEKSHHVLQQELRRLSQLTGVTMTQDQLVQVFREDAGTHNLPPISSQTLSRIRLKPMRSESGVQTVSALTKPFPCPGQCIFCPNDIRMPKSYIASEPGAQRAERNSFDPYLQTYSRLSALHNMGHQPTKIEIIILGGTWSDYPESYQIWFVQECFRALNDFGEGIDDCENIRHQIRQTVQTAHRLENRVVDSQDIAISGSDMVENYNQIISHYYLQPEIELEGGINVRRETKTWDELFAQHHRNESNICRCVGVTLETRPDNISPEEVVRMRRLGATKIQIGFQSLSDKVLELNKRGHDTAATKRAVNLLRQAGFKIHAHWMPNLYGSNLENDRQEYAELFNNPDYKPDELKIYPCALIPTAELMTYYQDGRWQPYQTSELADLLRFCLTHTPEWVRLSRVVRDIPSQETATDHLPNNLRQIVQDDLQPKDGQIVDIRAREIRHQTPLPPIELRQTEYETSCSQEIFLQYVDQKNRLLGFLRLSLPNENSFIEELADSAIIRELHVYGQVERLGEQDSGQTQHRGYGKKLIEAALQITKDQHYSKLSVISAIGTREYYRKQGFKDGQLYQSSSL